MKKVALYGRVSTEEQKLHGLSIAAQKQTLHKYCEDNGYTNIEEYFDEGVSASAMKKRKQFQRLLEDCRAGKIELILFTKLDRWFRHVGKYHVIQDELSSLGVPWKAVLEPLFETITAIGKGHINFYLTTAQIEVDRTSERIMDINKYKISQGQVLTGSIPFGYKIDPKTRKPIIDEETVHISRYILENYERVQSKRKMMREVYAKFGVPVNYNKVSEILKNKKYTGLYRGIPDFFPPIISVAQYEKNQEIVKRNVKEYYPRTGANKEHKVYIFSGLLKCAECGSMLGGTYSGMYKNPADGAKLFYRCQNHFRNAERCENNKVI